MTPPATLPLHVAIIPDGNGRWAIRRGQPRLAGHHFGAEAFRQIVAAARGLGITDLTFFAFSSDNWERPAREVEVILGVLRELLLAETPVWAERGTRVRVMGRRDRLTPALRAAILAAEDATASGRKLQLRLALDYSSRESILRAASRFYTTLEVSQEAFGRMVAALSQAGESFPNVDLLIRTGGEQRLSDFLLWECAYAEMVFSARMWPEFRVADLEAALREYRARDRRYGRLSEAVAG